MLTQEEKEICLDTYNDNIKQSLEKREEIQSRIDIIDESVAKIYNELKGTWSGDAYKGFTEALLNFDTLKKKLENKLNVIDDNIQWAKECIEHLKGGDKNEV